MVVEKEKKRKSMKSMSNKKKQLALLRSVIEILINKSAVPIIDLLVGKKHVNEFLIAKKLGLTINQTRNILYKLSDYGLVSFIRKKDKRKGWYIYFWTLNIYQSLILLEDKLKGELANLEEQLKNRNEKRYYYCETCSIEVPEEVALLNDFTCAECEEIYVLSGHVEFAEVLEKSIEKVKKDIEQVNIERVAEEEKLEKRKEKKIQDAVDEKKLKREERRKERAQLKKEEAEKAGIVEPKKKTVKKVKAKVEKKKPAKKKSVKKKSKKKSEKVDSKK